MALVVGGTTVTGTQTLEASTLTGTASAINGSNITNLPAPSAANVGTAIAAMDYYAVGTYGQIWMGNSGAEDPGHNHAAANLKWAGAGGSGGTQNISGTWELHGYHGSAGNLNQVSVWKRIA